MADVHRQARERVAQGPQRRAHGIRRHRHRQPLDRAQDAPRLCATQSWCSFTSCYLLPLSSILTLPVACHNTRGLMAFSLHCQVMPLSRMALPALSASAWFSSPRYMELTPSTL
jgi:hypothetical protein